MLKFLKQTFSDSYLVVTVIFAFVPEIIFGLVTLFPCIDNEWNTLINKLIIYALLLFATGIILCIRKKLRKQRTIKGVNYEIKVEYGDLFKMRNCWKLISFDECFTTKIGIKPQDIKPDSVCGTFLSDHQDLNIQELIKKSKLMPLATASEYNQQKRYESGRLIQYNNQYLLMSFVKLNKDGLGVMTLSEYQTCLQTLWEEIDKYYAMKDVAIPVLGSRIVRFKDADLNQQQLVDMVIRSYQMSPVKMKKPNKLHIVCKRKEGFSLNKVCESL